MLEWKQRNQTKQRWS